MQKFCSEEQAVDLREKSLGSSKDFMHENDVLIEEVMGDETDVLDVISVWDYYNCLSDNMLLSYLVC